MKTLFCIAVSIYRRIGSPMLQGLGCGCRFHPSCSAYAAEALGRFSWWRALGLIARRLFKCGPWHPGGVDPVPGA